MKLAITGSTGLIGHACVEELKARHDIIAMSRPRVGRKMPLADGVEYIETEYSEDELTEIICGCDGVIHLAARKVVPGEPEGSRHYMDSLFLLEKVIRAAQNCGISNIVDISSRCVYGNYTEDSFVEDAPLAPINFYAVEKIMAEQLAEFYNRERGMCIKTLRLSQVVAYLPDEKNMFMTFLKQALNHESITLYGEGKGVRDYIYVKDVCRGIEAAICAKKRKGIYNLGSGIGSSICQIAEQILQLTNSSGQVVHLMDKAEDCSRIVLNTDKMREEMGFSAQYDVNAMVCDILESMK